MSMVWVKPSCSSVVVVFVGRGQCGRVEIMSVQLWTRVLQWDSRRCDMRREAGEGGRKDRSTKPLLFEEHLAPRSENGLLRNERGPVRYVRLCGAGQDGQQAHIEVPT